MVANKPRVNKMPKAMKITKRLARLSVCKYLTEAGQIYCQGPILEAVQSNGLFNDSKHFVDMALKTEPANALKAFRELENTTSNRDVLSKFVEDHFHPPGTELESCEADDWVEKPRVLDNITDPRLKDWAAKLNDFWKTLCRKVKQDVKDRQELYSLLYVPHPFVIPGGRFREFYYWDTYWIVKGLLASDMFNTSRGMIKNLAYMVEKYGFVPNGGRIYYLTRSQPPLLAAMVHEYFMATADLDFVKELLPALEKEFSFWLNNRKTKMIEDGKETISFYQYKSTQRLPRPESWREDIHTAGQSTSQEAKETLWSNIAAGAESGWDFSSRWFKPSGPQANTLESIRTASIVPVDLNSFMCMNSRILSYFFEITGQTMKATVYQRMHEEAKEEIRKLHWSEEDGIWYDYDLETKSHIKQYYISNMLPLFAKCYHDSTVPKRVHNYLQRVGALNNTKGIPTSFINSQQQWDSDNAWAPSIHMVIEGFRQCGDPELYNVSERLAMNWVKTNYDAYQRTNAMFEKYNVSESSEDPAGGGGEYEVQTGFGWTNGVVLDLLSKYGGSLQADSTNDIAASISMCLQCLTPAVLNIAATITTPTPEAMLVN